LLDASVELLLFQHVGDPILSDLSIRSIELAIELDADEFLWCS
jgi:hypothetical protein